MNYFFSEDNWDNMIEHMSEKITKPYHEKLLKEMCTKEYRLKLFDKIVCGDLKINPPKLGYIPKEDGTLREVYIYTFEERPILYNITTTWEKLFGNKISSASKAYIKHSSALKTVKQLAREIKNGETGYKIDLKKFFDSVPKEILKNILDDLNTGSPIDDLIYTTIMDDRITTKDGLQERYKSICQGSPTSGFLCNYVLRKIDNELLKLNIIYKRYSDDMVILGKDSEIAFQKLKEELNKIGLEINEKKTEKINADEGFNFLGFTIYKDSVNIQKKHLKIIKSQVRHELKLLKKTDLKSVVYRIMKVLHNTYSTKSGYSWATYYLCGCTNEKQLHELDFYFKDLIRFKVTGKWNSTIQQKSISNKDLEENGYLSLVHCWKLLNLNKSLYSIELGLI